MKTPARFLSLVGLLAWVICSHGADDLTKITTVSLNGPWQVVEAGGTNWLPAKVPGCIHTDLLAAQRIPDPFFRENEKLVQWVGETNWIYRRTFLASPELLRHQRILLRCDGLDTLATVRLNGKELGRTDNMFRTWEFDVKEALAAGVNIIEVAFDSPLPVMRERNAERPMYEWIGSHEPSGRAWVRKEPCNFGWDWGPVLITCGIWRDIQLVAFDEARFTDISIQQDHAVKDQVSLTVQVEAETVSQEPLTAIIAVQYGDKTLDRTFIPLTQGKGAGALVIKQPQLWWPVGLGGQPLYDVHVGLMNLDTDLLDYTVKRIGLRTVKLLPPDRNQSLRLAVNGVTVFAKGANWIPADPFPNRVTTEKLQRYVNDAVAANMNLLRFWGGGYYEEPALFEACDAAGILVWLDFKFGCSSYPAFDPAFMDNVRQEVRDNVKRLRHHPSIAVWCGNNEISLMTKAEWSTNSMGKADYDKLFSDLIGGEVRRLAPQAVYVPGSPEVGDIHSWGVWHGDKPFESFRELNGFMSEFGFQSFPEPSTVATYTLPQDRASLLTPVMQWHQRSSGNGNQKIKDTTARYFHEPKDFESALWLSQILQGYGIKMGAEFWRQNQPASMGCVFWQYNDCWPVTSWSSVDYYGNWKALQYFARHFYAPVLVSGLENPTNNSVAIYATSDLREEKPATVSWEVTTADGTSLQRENRRVTLGTQASQLVTKLDLQALAKKHGAENLMVWLKLETLGQPASENLVTLARPKELPLVDPWLQTDIKASGKQFVVRLDARHPALWTWLELKGSRARYSDNFVHVRAGAPVEIVVTPDQPMTPEQFRDALYVHNLFDTYN